MKPLFSIGDLVIINTMWHTSMVDTIDDDRLSDDCVVAIYVGKKEAPRAKEYITHDGSMFLYLSGIHSGKIRIPLAFDNIKNEVSIIRHSRNH